MVYSRKGLPGPGNPDWGGGGGDIGERQNNDDTGLSFYEFLNLHFCIYFVKW